MSKSMIGLDPLAWLSPDGDSSISKKNPKKKLKKKTVAKGKSASNKKIAVKKKVASKKKVVAKKKILAKKKIVAKKKTSAKKKVLDITKSATNVIDSAVESAPYVSPLGLDVETLESSFSLLAPQAEQLVANFYKKLFADHPAVVPMFENSTLQDQQDKLLAALKLVIANIRKPDVLADVLKGLGEKHQGYGAAPEHYQAVGSTLIDVMRDLAGDAWTDIIESAWQQALTTISEVMLSAYAEITNEPEGQQVSDSIIKLSEVQDISLVAELHAQIAALINSDDITIDGSEVERIDASSLQVLTSAFIQAEKMGNSINWKGSSEALKQSAKLLGVTTLINL